MRDSLDSITHLIGCEDLDPDEMSKKDVTTWVNGVDTFLNLSLKAHSKKQKYKEKLLPLNVSWPALEIITHIYAVSMHILYVNIIPAMQS